MNRCTCPKNGAQYCDWCTALATRAGIALTASPTAPTGKHALTMSTQPAVKTDRYRSQTERRFVRDWLEPGVHDGWIGQWWYEPCKGLWLAPKTTYTPDFLVQPGLLTQVEHPISPYCLTFVEVKGPHIYAKDRIKAKLAASQYPCFEFLLAQWTRGVWCVTPIPAC